MTIYITKNNESEYRFIDWEEVIRYAKNRLVSDNLNKEYLNELNKIVREDITLSK